MANEQTELNWIEVGEYIAQRRKQQGMTQGELAKHARSSQPTISKIERGDGETTVDTLWKIAKALNIQPKTMLSKLKEM